MRSLRDNLYAVIDLNVVLMIGISFAALMVVVFIIWELRDQLLPVAFPGTTPAANASWNASYRSTTFSIRNITAGFDNAVNLLLIAITIFILAIAISALLMLRGR